MAAEGRKARVGEAIRDTLSEMIAREVKDPRVTGAGVVSITQVEMNVDLSVANVYVSVYGEDKAAERAVAGLKAAAGFLRGPLGRKLRLQRPPELRFHRDRGIVFGMELANIVREDEAKRKEAGTDAGTDTEQGAKDEEE
jgi:ribosome-binding factor A